MKTMKMRVAVGLCLLFCLLTFCSAAEEWDHFTYAQSWPPGTCADAPRGHHNCVIAGQINTWTVHGLWPSLGSQRGPTNCNSSYKFDFSEVARLQKQLQTYWPNLYTDTPLDSFWAHEWMKHGTCCTDLKETSGIYNYFSTGLMLNRKYDILGMLSRHSVVPSETAQYSYEDFVNAIKEETNYTPIIECAAKKLANGTTYHLIDQIQICLNKDFTPRACYSEEYPMKIIDTKVEVNINANGDETAYMIDRLQFLHGEPQSNCPRKYKFNYPPVHKGPKVTGN